MKKSRSVRDQLAPPQIVETYRRHCVGLIRFATVLVGPDDAHDVVSVAMLRMLERAPADVENPKAYLYKAVANQARNHKRGEARRRQREARDHDGRGVRTMPDPYPEVEAAIDRLSVRQRAVVYLTFWEDLTEDAIAAHLGIGAGSVRTHLARARRHLRRALHGHVR